MGEIKIELIAPIKSMGAFLLYGINRWGGKEKMEEQNKKIIGLVIEDGKKNKLYKLCKKYNVPLLYEELFKDENNYHLWGISKNGIALLGTEVMRRLDFVIHNLDEFETYLKQNKKS